MYYLDLCLVLFADRHIRVRAMFIRARVIVMYIYYMLLAIYSLFNRILRYYSDS